MKAHKFLVLTLFLFIPSFFFAEEKVIDLDLAQWVGKERSLPITPMLSHDNETLLIYSQKRLESLEITVRDSNGFIIYQEIATIQSGQQYSFNINPTDNGQYMIELRQGSRYLYGYFEIEEESR